MGCVIITLDRPRAMKLSHRAMKAFVKATGCKLEQMEDGIQDPEKLEALFWAMLNAAADAPEDKVTVGQMEELLDKAPMGTLYAAAGKAIELAFADPEADKEPDPTKAAGAM